MLDSADQGLAGEGDAEEPSWIPVAPNTQSTLIIALFGSARATCANTGVMARPRSLGREVSLVNARMTKEPNSTMVRMRSSWSPVAERSKWSATVTSECGSVFLNLHF